MGTPWLSMSDLRAEEAAGAVIPLWFIWLAMLPAAFGLQGVPRWTVRGLALSTALVMLLTVWGTLQRAANRLRPAPHR